MVFAPLAIIVHVLELNSPLTGRAALVFFVARIAHAFIYVFGIPLLRSIAFTVGFACQMILFGRIIGAM
jgi:uncharacterized MAPEG superfamily protein